MTTPKPKKKRAREKQARKEREAHAPGGTSGPVDRDVDESPAAVEERRAAQSGPGATGVPHTGAGAADHPGPSEQASDSVDDEHAARRQGSESDDEGDDADNVSFDPDASELREPQRDRIDPHTRHER